MGGLRGVHTMMLSLQWIVHLAGLPKGMPGSSWAACSCKARRCANPTEVCPYLLRLGRGVWRLESMQAPLCDSQLADAGLIRQYSRQVYCPHSAGRGLYVGWSCGGGGGGLLASGVVNCSTVAAGCVPVLVDPGLRRTQRGKHSWPCYCNCMCGCWRQAHAPTAAAVEGCALPCACPVCCV